VNAAGAAAGEAAAGAAMGETTGKTAMGAVAVGENILEIHELDVRLSGRKVLDRVSFSIAPGEFTGLIGSNGAGKTTLFRTILGLQVASAGAVLFGGPTHPHPHSNPRSRGRQLIGERQLIGFVPQKFLLDPDLPLRARDLVGLGLDAHRLGVPRPSRARRALVDQMLAAVDAERFADTRVGRLSGGEQQRILIAHALIARPRLLLLDEPLANLDLRSAHEVVALLARIAREQQIAVLISAHEINPLLRVMDRIVYLAAGRAVSGSTDEVVRADVLSKLYGHHVDVLNVHGRVLIVAGAGEATDLAGHEVAFPETEPETVS
jgi:zinc/manganese transport system ATP-binding protein